MEININESELRTLEQIEQFLDASAQGAFTAPAEPHQTRCDSKLSGTVHGFGTKHKVKNE